MNQVFFTGKFAALQHLQKAFLNIYNARVLSVFEGFTVPKHVLY